MIRCDIKTIWHGQAGVNEEKYIKPALATYQGLIIWLNGQGEGMEVSAEDVHLLQVGRSEHRFRDKYGGKDYYLVYYKWVPNVKQEGLL